MKVEIKTAIILGAIIAITITSLNIIFSSIDDPPQTSIIQNELNELQTQSIIKANFKKAPELVGIAEYINITPEELQKQIEGKVLLYDIWTYSCINCVRTLPYITEWNAKYHDDGLLVIGIHSPEFEFEKNLNNVQMAVKKHGITYPVVLDNEWKTWKAFENRYWPRKYVADHEGYIRYDHIGEGGYKETEKVIQELLQERATQLGLNVVSAEPLVEIEQFQHTSFRTPELYFGYKFSTGRNQLGSEEGFQPEKNVEYLTPQNIQQNYFYMDGIWKNLDGSMKQVSENGGITLKYFAKEVNIVTANEADLTILLDGEKISSSYAGKDVDANGKIHVSEAGLYNIINSNSPDTHTLKIISDSPGFEIYTFTFG